MDLSALQKGFKGKGKGDFKGKGRGTWGQSYQWNVYNKGDKGGMKGEKGGKEGFKGKGNPYTGKGYGNSYGPPPGVFNEVCHHCWEYGHSQ